MALGQTTSWSGSTFWAPFDLPPELADDYAKIPRLGEGMFPSKEAVVSARPDCPPRFEYNYDFDPAVGSATVEDLTQAARKSMALAVVLLSSRPWMMSMPASWMLGQILGVEATA